MSLNFGGVASWTADANGLTIPTYPYTIQVRGRFTDFDVNAGSFIQVGGSNGEAERLDFMTQMDGIPNLGTIAHIGPAAARLMYGSSANTIVLNTWQVYTAIFTGPEAFSLYIGNTLFNTLYRNDGARVSLMPINYAMMRLGEYRDFGMWSGAHTVQNIADAVTNNYAPNLIRSSELIHSWDFNLNRGGLGDNVGTADFVTNNPMMVADDLTNVVYALAGPVATIAVSPDTSSVVANQTQTYTITRSALVTGTPKPYTITSSNTNVATVPASAEIPVGQNTVTFIASALAPTTTTITVQSGVETDSSTLTVTAAPVGVSTLFLRGRVTRQAGVTTPAYPSDGQIIRGYVVKGWSGGLSSDAASDFQGNTGVAVNFTVSSASTTGYNIQGPLPAGWTVGQIGTFGLSNWDDANALLTTNFTASGRFVAVV